LRAHGGPDSCKVTTLSKTVDTHMELLLNYFYEKYFSEVRMVLKPAKPDCFQIVLSYIGGETAIKRVDAICNYMTNHSFRYPKGMVCIDE